MLNPPGWSEIIEPGKRAVEMDTTNCVHCRAIMFVKPGFNSTPQMIVIKGDGTQYMKEATSCPRCFGWVCPKAACNKECVPFLKKLEIEEAVARRTFLCS